jgi:hypothetical protein
MVITGDGLTVMVNVLGIPEHPLATGVTVMVAVTWLALVLIAVNVGMVPNPEADNPIDGLLLVQL